MAQQINTSGGRFYDLGDEGTPDLVPSVTHALSAIAKPALVPWAAAIERRIAVEAAATLYARGASGLSRPSYIARLQTEIGRERAAQREIRAAAAIGTQAHRLIEWNLRRRLGQSVGAEPVVEDAATWAVMAWEDWAASVDLEPILVEQVVYSRRYRFAGTMDLLARVDGVETVLDWKTGKAVYPEAHLQNAAYQEAIVEMGHGSPTAGIVVRLPKVETDPAFEVVEVAPRGDLLPTFLAVLEVWRWWYAGEAAYKKRRAGAA